MDIKGTILARTTLRRLTFSTCWLQICCCTHTFASEYHNCCCTHRTHRNTKHMRIRAGILRGEDGAGGGSCCYGMTWRMELWYDIFVFSCFPAPLHFGWFCCWITSQPPLRSPSGSRLDLKLCFLVVVGFCVGLCTVAVVFLCDFNEFGCGLHAGRIEDRKSASAHSVSCRDDVGITLAYQSSSCPPPDPPISHQISPRQKTKFSVCVFSLCVNINIVSIVFLKLWGAVKSNDDVVKAALLSRFPLAEARWACGAHLDDT